MDLLSTPADIHACGSALCSEVKLHLVNVDKRLPFCLYILLAFTLTDLLLGANFIDLGH